MKKLSFLICFVFAILLAGCAGSEGQALEAVAATQMPAPAVTSTPAPRSPTPSSTPKPGRVVTSTVSPTLTPFPPEARVTAQCLDIARRVPDDAVSNGIVVLTDWGGFYTEECVDAYSVDMITWKRTQIGVQDAIQAYFYVSPGRDFFAYRYWSLEEFRNGSIHRYLVISDVNGKTLKTIPWGNNWFDLIGWLDDQRLLFMLSRPDLDLSIPRKPFDQLVFNPFSGERWLLRPDLLPEWDGGLAASFESSVGAGWIKWLGAVYDPTLTLVVYPRLIDLETGNYTYGLWNIPEQRLASELESVINGFADTNYYPRPDWYLDGSKFAVVGGVADPNSGDVVGRELFRVTKDGQVGQLTHLGDSAYVWASSHSWSPDGRYIALYLSPVDGSTEKARLAVLDTETLELVDYCVTVHAQDEGFFREQSPAPIWSPDGKQLLVVDQLSIYYRQVIWVDLEHGVAALLADDRGAAGWMLAPEE